ncbi:MAG: hypothetical protein FVQ83_15420 [Chloroflexi bacterium]|nr:hypothetical protein [Chloroflexota bacterium]
MKPRERIFAALNHAEVDRVPRFEIWIDHPLDALGQESIVDAYANLGQDCILLPSHRPPESNAWRDGTDEWGCVWVNGMYSHGLVESEADLEHYSPHLDYVKRLFDSEETANVRSQYPDHCLIFGTHVGPLTAGFMAMGFERFFSLLIKNPDFVHKVLEARTDYCIALYQQAISLGAELVVLGDDAAHRDGPMISPSMWREFIMPYHSRIVEELEVPVIWHSDGNILPLLPYAIEAGFVGFHGLEPAAGINLSKVKQEYGQDLVLVGNIDVGVLCANNMEAVRQEVHRCLEQGAPGGGYMVASCNSIFEGMNPKAVLEMFHYLDDLGI